MSSNSSLFRVLSRVQTQNEVISSPAKLDLYQKRYTDIMIFCLVQGDAIKNSFPIDISGHETIGHLKMIIKNAKQNTFGSIDADKLILWRVNIIQTKENQTTIIKEHKGAELHSFESVGNYFQENPTSTNIRVIVEPPATTASSMHIVPDEVKIEVKNKVIKAFPHINAPSIDHLVDALALIWHVEVVKSHSSSSRNDPYVELKAEPSFYKISLPRGITEQTFKTVDLCLPSYNKFGMDYHNPFYDDPQFRETVSLVKKKIDENPKDVVVLAGVSGGGKTSTAFGIAIQSWSIYIDCSPYIMCYGSNVISELHEIRNIKPEFEHYDKQSEVFRILDTAVISRGLLLIKLLTEGKISTPKEWLFVQLQMNDSEFREILDDLKKYDVKALFDKINNCLDIGHLTLIFDEAQVLCEFDYGKYKGSSVSGKKWNLLQSYIAHLNKYPVTCLLAGTYMHMASGVSLLTSVGKGQGLHAHIVLKLPFLLHDDVLRNLNAVIDLTHVAPKICNLLGYILMGRPRNCASFVRLLILTQRSDGRTKDQMLKELLNVWYNKISGEMAGYLANACESGADYCNPETAIMDVLRLRVFYNHRFKAAIELLQHSIIPCQSPECITLGSDANKPYSTIEINPLLESYLVSSIEIFLKNKREKTLVEAFVYENIIRLNNISSIGNEFDAAFITAIIQKRGRYVREELNKWKNGQQFEFPSWITPTMKFVTMSNLSGTVPITEYVNSDNTYRYFAIQPEICSGSDLLVSLVDDDENVILLSASCTVTGSSIARDKVKKQLIKSCMKFQYMELPNKRKNSETAEFSSNKKKQCFQTGIGEIPVANEEDNDEVNTSEEEEVSRSEEEEVSTSEKVYGQYLDFYGADYDLDYTKNIENYRISNISEHAGNHKKIKSSTENRKHIYVSVELPRRQSKKRPQLFRINDYGDLVIIVDDRNMEHVFGPVIKKLMESLRQRCDDSRIKKY